jgi:hypothetical protein
MTPKRKKTWISAILLLAAPAVLLGIVVALQRIDLATAKRTLVGIAITSAGGLIAGALAERLLHRGKHELMHLLGVIATTAIGVLTISYLYLVEIRGPMSTIGSLPRAVHQGIGFIAFLTAQGAGMLISATLGPPPTQSPSPSQESR